MNIAEKDELRLMLIDKLGRSIVGFYEDGDSLKTIVENLEIKFPEMKELPTFLNKISFLKGYIASAPSSAMDGGNLINSYQKLDAMGLHADLVQREVVTQKPPQRTIEHPQTEALAKLGL